MSIGRILLAMALSAMGTSLAGWFFFGVWMHDRYLTHPETWRRPRGGTGEGRAVGLAALVSVLTPIGFVVLCAAFGLTTAKAALGVALITWLAVSLPPLVTNALFIKIDPWLLVPHATGRLAELVIPAVVVAWLL